MKVFICILVVSFGAGLFTCAGQSFRAVDFEQALSFIEKKHGISFSYDKDLVSNTPVFIDTTASLSRLIEQINAVSAFTFNKIDNTHYLVKPKRAGGNFLVRGRILDEKTNEPLYSASVFSKKNGRVYYTDENGFFSEIINFHDNDTLVISSIGYERIKFPVKSFVQFSPPSIKLKSVLVELQEYTVTSYLTSGIDYASIDNSIIIRPKSANVLTGMTNNDLLASLDALPGISMTDGKPGNINIRGSTPDQTMVMFDNIPVYQKGHLFGMVSAFNSNMVDNVKVHRSFVSASKGGRAGGLIEINSPSEIANKPALTVSASLLDASVYTHLPLIKNKLSFFVSGRSSFPYAWNLPPMQSMSDFVFQFTEISGAEKNDPSQIKKLNPGYYDGNAKLIYQLNEKHKLELSGLYNHDFMDFDAFYDGKSGRFRETSLNISNSGANATLSSRWTNKITTSMVLTGSAFTQEATATKFARDRHILTDSYFKNQVNDYRGFFQLQYRVNEKNMVDAGYDYHHYNTIYTKASNDSTNTSLRKEYLKPGDIHTFFTNYLATPAKWFDINAGLRLNYFTTLSAFYLEPRLCMGFKLSDKFRLKFTGGYQYQFIAQVSGISIEHIGGIENVLWMLADKHDVPVVNSFQTSGGFVYNNKGWLIDLESYYRFTDNLSSVSLTDPNGPDPYIHGSVKTIGCDLLIRKSFKHLDIWTSYTLSHSTMQFDSVQAEPFTSLYDQTHVFDIAASYHYKNWRFSLSWKYRTGLAALPGIRERMLAGANSDPNAGNQSPVPPGGPVFSVGTEYKDRFPDYHCLDAYIGYEFSGTMNKYKSSIGVSLLNVYNRKNIIGQVVQFNAGQPGIYNRYSLGFTPNIILTVRF